MLCSVAPENAHQINLGTADTFTFVMGGSWWGGWEGYGRATSIELRNAPDQEIQTSQFLPRDPSSFWVVVG